MFLYIFRHLNELYDGKIQWNASRGDIGLELLALNENLKDIVDFDPIETNMPLIDPKVFKGQNDLKCLVEHCFIVAYGKNSIDDYLKNRTEEKEYPTISTVRWRTTALRALGKR